jgi:hypothetical protein
MTSPSRSAPWGPLSRSGLVRPALALLCLLAVGSPSPAQFPQPRPGAYGPGVPSRFDPTSPYFGGGRIGVPGIRMPSDPGYGPGGWQRPATIFPPGPVGVDDVIRDPLADVLRQPHGPAAFPGGLRPYDSLIERFNRIQNQQRFATGQPPVFRPQQLDALRQVQVQPPPPLPPDLSRFVVPPAVPKFPLDRPAAPRGQRSCPRSGSGGRSRLACSSSPQCSGC